MKAFWFRGSAKKSREGP